MIYKTFVIFGVFLLLLQIKKKIAKITHNLRLNFVFFVLLLIYL